MLKRCHSPEYRPTYAGCSVCEDWLTFSNFKCWMEQQDWEGKVLDKDLLVYQNKVYSPETCCFIPAEVNGFILISRRNRGEYPIGVSKIQNRVKNYEGYISRGGVKVHLGCHTTVYAAHSCWRLAKIKQAEYFKRKYKDSECVVEGMNRIITKLNNDIQLGVISEDY